MPRNSRLRISSRSWPNRRSWVSCGRRSLRQAVQGGAGAEPVELRVCERVVQPQGFGRAVGVVDPALDGLVGCQGAQVEEAQAIVRAYAVVVGGVCESEGQEALFLEVGFVDAGEATGDDGHA